MATTYSLISSNVLSASAASVTFSAIPSTYTDLVLRASTRSTNATINASYPYIDFGGTTTSSSTMLGANGATPKSMRNAPAYAINYDGTNGSDSAGNTASTFDTLEWYIPNYAGTTLKPLSIIGAAENNTSTAYMQVTAGLTSMSTAISTIRVYTDGQTFAIGSSFYLYGIKNS
jgi:hypothetical protein